MIVVHPENGNAANNKNPAHGKTELNFSRIYDGDFGRSRPLSFEHIKALVVFEIKMAEHDLTQELCKNLDRHLAFPLLEFLSNKQLYSETDIQKAKIDLLQKTNMVDYAAEIYTALYKSDDIPEEMNTRRKEVVAKLKTLQVCFSSSCGACGWSIDLKIVHLPMNAARECHADRNFRCQNFL